MKILHNVISLLLLAMVAGCATSGPLAPAYKPAVKMFPGPKSEHISLLKPREARAHGPKSGAASGVFTLIPLVPFLSERRSPEDEISSGTDKPYDFLADLGNIAVKDLETSGIARKVTFQDGTGTEAPEASHTLHLTVKHAAWRRYPTMYGISLAALPFQLFGAPVAFGRFELDVETELMDAKGKSLGKAYLTTEVKFRQYLYSSDVLRARVVKAYDQVSPQLRNFVAQAIDPAGTSAPPAMKGTVDERLKKLKELKDDGLINDEDFQKRKEAILKEI